MLMSMSYVIQGIDFIPLCSPLFSANLYACVVVKNRLKGYARLPMANVTYFPLKSCLFKRDFYRASD